MDFLKNLFGMKGGKRSRRMRRRGGACASGEACATQFSADSSLTQGEAFAKMTAAYHGGKRSRRARRMRGGSADISTAFDVQTDLHAPAGIAVLDNAMAELNKFAPQSGGRQSGGSAELADAFQAPSAELHNAAGTSVLDTAISQIAKFSQTGGKSRSRKYRGGSSPIDAPSMLLRSEDYPAAFLSPQWAQENIVNPNFRGVENAYAGPSVGGFFFGRPKSIRHKTMRRVRRRKATHKKSHKCPRGKTYRKTYLRKGRRIMGKCVKK